MDELRIRVATHGPLPAIVHKTSDGRWSITIPEGQDAAVHSPGYYEYFRASESQQTVVLHDT